MPGPTTPRGSGSATTTPSTSWRRASSSPPRPLRPATGPAGGARSGWTRQHGIVFAGRRGIHEEGRDRDRDICAANCASSRGDLESPAEAKPPPDLLVSLCLSVSTSNEAGKRPGRRFPFRLSLHFPFPLSHSTGAKKHAVFGIDALTKKTGLAPLLPEPDPRFSPPRVLPLRNTLIPDEVVADGIGLLDALCVALE